MGAYSTVIKWYALCGSCVNTEIDNDTSLREKLSKYEPDIPDKPAEEFNLQHFSYANSGVLDLIFNHLEATNFAGITESFS